MMSYHPMTLADIITETQESSQSDKPECHKPLDSLITPIKLTPAEKASISLIAHTVETK